jgi:hypothetical protein
VATTKMEPPAMPRKGNADTLTEGRGRRS